MDDTTLSNVALADDGTRLVGSAELFRRLNERLPGWYAKRYLTTAEAARVLGRDTSTVRQQAIAGVLRGRRTERGWTFSIRDLSNYIAAGKWRGSAAVRRWTSAELEQLAATGTCPGRSRNGVKLKKYRLRKHGSTQDHRQAL
ncbi:helix-turn-helix domain-containing protein [Caldimonas thermodepolymerans]|uniref:Helix-turn-helix domain-containing protein n=1 Tax=Caldimonas thermodepolymerans TaxID=215580 RepID=A0AA46DCI3_9BURK|nr:helix-turn-helix domain-containing protein [Caldimonas thermodepolymerans]TCP06605.1 hypothetical protein EV676_10688 [Caldimonas thermodepolymerans]UZG49337.1 helix-turn-helix domain-containing protein [Caldimonas thermodepolymerans]